MTLKTKIILASVLLLISLAVALGYAISPAAEAPLALIILGFALFIPLSILWPVGGLFGAVFLRHSLDIFTDKTITIFSLHINFAVALGLLVLLGALIYFLNGKINFKNLPLKNYWLFFLLVITLSLPLAVEPTTALREWLKVIISFSLFAVGAFYFGLKERREKIEKLIIWALLIPLALALYQIITSSGLIGFGLPSRAFGTYGHPNVLAFNLVIGIGLLFYLWRTHYIHKKWPIIFIGLGIIALLFTYTRAGYIGLAVFAIVLGLFEYRALTIKIFTLLGILALLFFPINNWLKTTYHYDLQNNPLIYRLTSQEEEFNSLDWRRILWQQSLNKFWQRPILGWGYGMFGNVLSTDRSDVDPPEAHNDYLRLIVETGGLGLISYLILQTSILYALFKRWRNYAPRTHQKLQFAIMIALTLTLLVESLSDNILHATALQWSWLLLLGASLAEPWKQTK